MALWFLILRPFKIAFGSSVLLLLAISWVASSLPASREGGSDRSTLSKATSLLFSISFITLLLSSHSLFNIERKLLAIMLSAYLLRCKRLRRRSILMLLCSMYFTFSSSHVSFMMNLYWFFCFQGYLLFLQVQRLCHLFPLPLSNEPRLSTQLRCPLQIFQISGHLFRYVE